MSTEPEVSLPLVSTEPHGPGLQGPAARARQPVGGLMEDGEELPPGERASTLFLVVVAGLSCAADLLSKGWAQARLAGGVDGRRPVGKSITVIDGYLDLIFAQNPGGAWSFARELPEGLRRPFFLFISAAAIVFIVSIYRRVHRDQTSMKWGLPLALGGAIGNLVDRIRFGWVVDFIDVYFRRGAQEHHWPTFNIADVAIVVGVALMGVNMITSSRRARAGEPAAEGEAEQAGEPAAGVVEPHVGLAEVPAVGEGSRVSQPVGAGVTAGRGAPGEPHSAA